MELRNKKEGKLMRCMNRCQWKARNGWAQTKHPLRVKGVWSALTLGPWTSELFPDARMNNNSQQTAYRLGEDPIVGSRYNFRGMDGGRERTEMKRPRLWKKIRNDVTDTLEMRTKSQLWCFPHGRRQECSQTHLRLACERWNDTVPWFQRETVHQSNQSKNYRSNLYK